MTTLDEALAAQARPAGRPCGLPAYIAKLPPDLAAKFEAAVYGTVPAPHLVAAMTLPPERKGLGYPGLTEDTIKRHRAGRCQWCNRLRDQAA